MQRRQFHTLMADMTVVHQEQAHCADCGPASCFEAVPGQGSCTTTHLPLVDLSSALSRSATVPRLVCRVRRRAPSSSMILSNLAASRDASRLGHSCPSCASTCRASAARTKSGCSVADSMAERSVVWVLHPRSHRLTKTRQPPAAITRWTRLVSPVTEARHHMTHPHSLEVVQGRCA